MFWKEVNKTNGGKVESCNRIKDGNGRLSLESVGVQRIWKEYFQDIYNIDTQEQAGVNMCGFDGVQKSNNFGGQLIRRTDIRMGNLKYGKAAGKDEVKER